MRLRTTSNFMEPPPLPLLQLPGPVLQAVLQQLSTRDVASAARTCTQLHAAAAGALDSMAATGWLTPPRLASLLLYLERHGQHVRSLDMRTVGTLSRLPPSCSRLQALSLAHGRVQLGGSDSQPGVLQAVSALTSLYIERGTLADSAQGVAAAVALLTQLQRLVLGYCTITGGGGVLPGSMLAPLQSLTALHLSPRLGQRWLHAATLQHLSSLRGLRQLHLRSHGSSSGLGPALTAVQHLHQLTSLVLHRVAASGLPDLSSSLQRLELEFCPGLDPQALAAHTQLRRLLLDARGLPGGPEGTATLLAHLQQLTRLHLCGATWRDAPAPAAAYAALTASSSLEVLDLYASKLPAAAFQAMFAGSKRLPRLHALDLDESISAARLQPADLEALVRCCPALQRLRLSGSPGLHTADLQPLTALTGLAWLCAYDSTGDFYIELQTPAGQPPDVARQLQEEIQDEEDEEEDA